MKYKEDLQVLSCISINNVVMNCCTISGLGNYKLLAEFKPAERSPLNLITCYSPQEIVDQLRNRDSHAAPGAHESGKQ